MTGFMLLINVSFAQTPVVSYSGPQTYIKGSAITPLVPASTGGGLVAYSSTVDTLPINYGIKEDIVIDRAGNFYLPSTVPNNQIIKILAGTLKFDTLTVNPGTYGFESLQRDSANNLYGISDPNIYKIPAGTTTLININAGHTFRFPSNIAIDRHGNVYVTDFLSTTIQLVELPAGGGSAISRGPANSKAVQIAVDSADNIYYSKYQTDSIFKIPANSNAATFFAVCPTFPSRFSIDASGNLYVASDVSSAIYEYTAGNNVPLVINGYPGAISGQALAIDLQNNLFALQFLTSNGPEPITKILPTGGYYIQPALPPGMVFDSNTGIISGRPATTAPPKTYTIMAYNSSGNSTATVTIGVIAKVGADLQSINLTHGTLSPGFDPDSTNYSVYVEGWREVDGIIPTVSNPNATITVNGVPVASGKSTGFESLNLGPNVFSIVVTDAGDTLTKTYTVTIYKGSATARLSNLVCSSGVYNQPFLPEVYNYNLSVSKGTNSVVVTPTTVPFSSAIITVNGTIVQSGTASIPISLNADSNFIHIEVTSPLTDSIKTYTIKVLPANDAALSAIQLSKGTLSPLFAESVTNYTTQIPRYDYANIGFRPLTDDPKATVTVNGNAILPGKGTGKMTLNYGSNTFNILVTAADSITTKTYTLTVTYGQSAGRSANDAIIPYPNPFVSTVSLNLGDKPVHNTSIEIHNTINGKLVYSKQYSNRSGVLQVDLSGINLERGVYAIHITTDNTEKVFKIEKK